MNISGFYDILTIILTLVLMCMVGYFAFVPNRESDLENRSEIAGRAVLICTFFITLLMFLGVYIRSGRVPDIPDGILTINGMAVAIYFVVQFVSTASSARESRLKLVQARKNVNEQPDSVSYAWELAAATLEDYLNRNLSQVKWIFNVAVFVMLCGFIVVCYGVSMAMRGDVMASIATSGAGVITQFIGATFMVIYRSTMAQAGSYVTLLERMNNIGMAVQILEKMADAPTDIKNNTRVEIIKSLLIQARENVAINFAESEHANRNVRKPQGSQGVPVTSA